MQPVARRLLQFDPDRLAAEYRKIEGHPWMQHPSNLLHDDAWYALPLFAVNGAMEQMVAKVGEFGPTPAFLETQAFKQVLDVFQCPFKRVRLLRLKAGGCIREHTDEPYYGDQKTVNIHIPIHTNPDVQFVVGGRQFHMQPGECWGICNGP
jgi:Aspartyl/Asparaginyl beta-hydroxylase